MPRRENTFRVDYSQFPKLLSHDEIIKFIGKELGLTRENVLLLQPSRRLGCTFVEVNNLELAETIVQQHDNKHEFVFDRKAYKLRITMEDGAVEVSFFDLSNNVTNEQIADFLAEYGDVLHVRDLLWDERSAFAGVKTGVRIARMVVKKNIPSLVTIQGEDTGVGYKGQRQTCLHCQEYVHVGIPCVQNKKLLVQKLVAEQSYANVAKQPAKPNNPPSKPAAPNTRTPSASRQSTNKQANDTRAAAELQKCTMPPPATSVTNQQKTSTGEPVISIKPLAIPIGTTNISRKNDGNETDSSQSSQSSRRTRSRRSPPGKKMRTNDEAISTAQNSIDQQ